MNQFLMSIQDLLNGTSNAKKASNSMKSKYMLRNWILLICALLNLSNNLPCLGRACGPFNPQGPILMLMGTRPEAIKLLPLYKKFKKRNIPIILCCTGQHKELIEKVFTIFNVEPDINLEIMKERQDLFHITTTVLEKTKELFNRLQPSLIIVQGDTTSAMAGALAAFYLKIPVGHVEAGLRTYDRFAPYPEELNRCIISLIARYHFAPTEHAYQVLINEGIKPETMILSGNTVVDALHMVKRKIEKGEIEISKHIKELHQEIVIKKKKLLLLTMHRRESFDQGLEDVLCAIKEHAVTHENTTIVYARHPNPIIKNMIEKMQLTQQKNIIITEPLSYPDLIFMLVHADLIATDSGGIQEEAVSLHKHVLVLREKTERPEGIEASFAHLIGTKKEDVIKALNTEYPVSTRRLKNVYGDGHASDYIADFLMNVELKQ